MFPRRREKFLTAHRLGDTEFYKIKLDDKPSAIRDQLKKAVTFVDAAHSGKRILRGEKMLIIGAGVAGVAAAWRAVELGIQTFLQDQAPEPFSVQASCDSRLLHPHEYAWPRPHYEASEFPHPALDADLSGVPELLHWRAMPPSQIARIWQERFRDWVDENRQIVSLKGPIKWKRRTFPRLSERTDMNGYIRRLVPVGRFDLVLVCVGGAERCSVGKCKHRSFRFWETDPYGASGYGVRFRRRRVERTLISGGGDGALQDFLRIACHKRSFPPPIHALQIYEKLVPNLLQCRAFHQMLAAMAGVGGDINRPAPAKLWRIHTRFLKEVVWEVAGVELAQAVDALIDPRLLEQKRTLDLNFAAKHFKKAFALNAFLVRLFIWRIEARTGRTVFQPGARLKKVSSATSSHACNGDPGPNGCLLKPHSATFEQGETVPLAVPPRVYDVIVIRHGVTS